MNKNIDNKFKYIYELVFSLVITAVSILMLWLFSSGPFYTNDELVMRTIASGEYLGKSDGHLIYIMYVYGFILSVLYKLIPCIQWYDIIIITLHSLAWWTVVFAIGRLTSGSRIIKSLSMSASMVVVLGLDASHFLYSQFTLIAGVLMAIGVFYFVLSISSEEASGFDLAMASLFCTFSMLLRKQVFYMGAPFLGVFFIYLLLKKTPIRKMVKPYVALLLPIVLCISVDCIAYNSVEWKNYNDFNDNWAYIQDYCGVPVYEYASDAYEKNDMTEADYHVLQGHNICFVDEYDLVASKDIAQAGENLYNANVKNNGFRFLISATKKEYINMFKSSIGMIILVVIIGLCIILINKRDIPGIVLLCGVLGYHLVFSFYFIYKNRFPERVSLGLYIIELSMLVAILVTYNSGQVIKKPLEIIFIVVCAIIGIYGIGTEVKKIKSNTAEWDFYVDETAAISEYANENRDDTFLIAGNVANFMCDRMVASKCNDAYNIVPLSFWMKYSPLYLEKMSRQGTNSYSRALLFDNSYKLIQRTDDVSWLEEYYCAHDYYVSVSIIDRIYSDNEELYVVAVENNIN